MFPLINTDKLTVSSAALRTRSIYRCCWADYRI